MELEEEVGHGGKRRTAATRNSGKKLWSSGLYDNDSGAVMLNLPPGFSKYKADLEEELMEEFYGEAAGGVGAHQTIDAWVKDWIERKAKEDPSVLEDEDQG